MSLPDLQELASTCHDFSWNDASGGEGGPKAFIPWSRTLRGPASFHPAPLDVDESEEDPKDFDPAETFGYAIAATISANKNGESLSLFFFLVVGWMWSQRNSG